MSHEALSHHHQLLSSVDLVSWQLQAAIKKDLNLMKLLGVCTVGNLTPSIKTVGTTWVF
jgi:hypothetical protein